MTRDTKGLSGLERDDAILAEAWASAPFPRLPIDAPDELRNLAIEVDDPTRVYAIHRAARRHHFHILVERYIFQLRYGCQNRLCDMPTCFSYRKRIAAGVPIRRYNSTSARTLAVYLASIDNPEQGLCRNSHAEKIPVTTKKGASHSSIGDRKQSINIYESSGSIKLDLKSSALKGRRSQFTITEDTTGSTVNTESKPTLGESLDEPTAIDHKSFVQNLAHTVAFKMVEWLTPRNLERCADSDKAVKSENLAKSHTSRSNNQEEADDVLLSRAEDKANKSNESTDNELSSAASDKNTQQEMDLTLQKSMSHDAELKTNVSSRSHDPSNPISPRRRSSTLKTKSSLSNPPIAKEVLSISAPIKASDNKFEKRSKSRDRQSAQHKSRLAQKGIVISPKTETILPISKEGHKALNAAGIAPIIDATENATSVVVGSTQVSAPKPKNQLALSSPRSPSLPQTLSHLPLEVIDLICRISHVDHTLETHSLYPSSLESRFDRFEHVRQRLWRKQMYPTPVAYPLSLKKQWRDFIEQAIYDVFHRPVSLLRTFSNEDKTLFDSAIVWEIMLRMTRTAPSLVFDSLWIAMGDLFAPQDRAGVNSKSLSDSEVASMVSLALHALVATAPLVLGERQLGNMSRIRSKGLVLDDLEPVSLCLAYEDAFTTELALRLARRVFSVIATRRTLSSVAANSKEHSSRQNGEADVLRTILESARSFDSDSPPYLIFSDEERALHEKRVPFLILDWARTVILQAWDGSAEIPTVGPFGGALATIDALYKDRKALHLGDIHFQTEFFAERLDPVQMPLQWVKFQPNKKFTHLLNFPYLFTPAVLVTYFRAINYSCMNDAYETARTKKAFMKWASSDKHMDIDSSDRETLQERLTVSTSEFLVLGIRRTHVLQDTFDSIWRREHRELMRPLKIRLGEDEGEMGQDNGGVQQEFFGLAMAEALNPDHGAFTQDVRTKMSWFQPGSPEPLWRFKLIGMIVSLAVYNGLTLPITFPKALYKKLLDEEVSELHHIADGWPELEKGLNTVIEWDEADGSIADVFSLTYEFSASQFGQAVSRDMGASSKWPQSTEAESHVLSNTTDAPSVTNENRNSYVSDYIRWLTDVSVRPQFEAFKYGFYTCLDRRAIKLFDADTLQSIVEGVQEIDIDELRHVAEYEGWDSTHHTIKDFWSIIEEYDMEGRKKLLEFVTASDRLPVGGMKNLIFAVYKNGVGDERLPSSSTCYGILNLPEYSSKEEMRKKLRIALWDTEGFFLQ